MSDPKIILNGGQELTPQEAKEALDKAMTIIETVGTTGVERTSIIDSAAAWMERYFPTFA